MGTKGQQRVLWLAAISCSSLSLAILVVAEREKSRSIGPEPTAILNNAYWWYLVGALLFAMGTAAIWKFGLERGYPLPRGRGWGSWWSSLLVGGFVTLWASYLPPRAAGRLPTNVLLVLIGVHLLTLGLIELISMLLRRVR